MKTFTTLAALVASATFANAQGLYIDLEGRTRCTIPNASYCSGPYIVQCDGTFALDRGNCNAVSVTCTAPPVPGYLNQLT